MTANSDRLLMEKYHRLRMNGRVTNPSGWNRLLGPHHEGYRQFVMLVT
jgi:hypothetical protein